MDVSVSRHEMAGDGRGGGPTTAEARGLVLEWLDLLGSAEAQLAYQRAVPAADVPAELYCVWFDDLEACFTEAHFSAEELAQLRWFTRRMDEVGDAFGQRPPPVEALVASPAWQRVVALAVETAAAIRGAAPGRAGG